MFPMRRMLACVVIAFALGCTNGGGGTLRRDAGRDGRTDVDGRADSRKETGPVDARPRDATSKDTHSGDAGSQDGGPMGADSGDASPGDARSTDARRSDADGQAPTDTTLLISPLTMTPSFSVTTYDYYVRCAAGQTRSQSQ